MNIDFIAFNKNPALYLNDPSFIYRCQNLAQGLHQQNCNTRMMHIKQYTLHHRATPDIVVLHRPLYSLRLIAWITLLKRKGVTLIADIDDLVFHPDFTAHSPAVKNHILTEKQIAKRYKKHYQALSHCDIITTSTQPLADKLKAYFPDKTISLIHNAVHYSWHQQFPTNALDTAEKQKVLTYFPGTKSHDKDFALINTPLEAFLNDHADIHLSITGQLDYELNVPKAQISYTPRVAYEEYAARVAASWLNLCPLEQSPFNDCKSALKVIEAGHWGTPTLASPNPDVSRFIASGLATIAESDAAWYDQLSTLTTTKFNNKKLQQQGKKLTCYKIQAKKFYQEVQACKG